MPRVLGVLLLSVSAFAQLRITSSSVPAVTQYQSYSTTLAASGGTQPYTWSVVSSSGVSLPEGMTLNASTGVVSAAQVNGQGGYAVTIQVTDSASPSHNTATATLDFGVNSDTGWAGCQVFPVDSIFNQRVDHLPVDTAAADQTPSAYLNSPLHPDFGHGFYPGPGGIPWMRVPANAATTKVNLGSSGQITAAGTYSWPFPAWPNALLEGTSYGANGDDHHTLILQSSVNNITGPQTGPCILYETYNSSTVQGMFNAGTNTWSEEAGSDYVLNSNEIATSTSTLDDGAQDSPGIPMVPLLVRYSEVPEMVQHPLRITTPWSTNWFSWPATGCCSGTGTPQGLLYRLKASVNWQATCPVNTNPQAATVLLALQQYGAYMSDHGSAGYMQGVPDIRWNDDDLGCIKKFHMSDLEVVNNSVLEISSISGQTKPYVVPATLAGVQAGAPYSYTFAAVGGNAATRQWSVSAGALPPGLVLNASTGALSGLIGPGASGTYSFSMTAKDTSSGSSSVGQAFSIAVSAFIVTIQNATVTVTSSPVGLRVSVDGATCTTPQNFSWDPGSNHTIGTTSPQGAGGRDIFAGWSDGGAQSHPVMAPFTGNATFTANFVPPPTLSIGLKQNGTFTQGENNATYTITVSDSSATATSGSVTVTENLTAGLTLISMSGNGWSCLAHGTTCTRGDSLAAGGSYPAITVTVDIAPNAALLVLNAVSVSGGGGASTEAVDLSVIRRAINAAGRASQPGFANNFDR